MYSKSTGEGQNNRLLAAILALKVKNANVSTHTFVTGLHSALSLYEDHYFIWAYCWSLQTPLSIAAKKKNISIAAIRRESESTKFI